MLPNITTSDQYRAFDLRGPEIREAALKIFDRLQITANKIDFAKDGSSPVVIIDDERVLKLFAPLYADGFYTEEESLKFVSRAGAVSPELLNIGSLENWNYILMSKLKGQSLKSLWPELAEAETQIACYEIGKNLRKIHNLKTSEFHHIPSDWGDFMESQKKNCVQHHEKTGLRTDLVNQISSFLDSVELIQTGPPSFLHTEVMRDHVFFDQRNGNTLFTGFIDFEPAMVGEVEYDFASVGIFLSAGNKKALNSFFKGYGILDSIDLNFKRRVMAYTLLHRYSNLNWYLDFMPNASTLDELAELWWAI